MKYYNFLIEERQRMYELTRDGKYIHVGTELEVLKKLHEVCSASAEHCMRYEGYKMKEFGRNYRFENIHLDSHSGQHDYTLVARDEKGKAVGRIIYSVFQDNVHANIIKVNKDARRQGIAVMLTKWLMKQTGKRWKELRLGMVMSKEGKALTKYMDKIF